MSDVEDNDCCHLSKSEALRPLANFQRFEIRKSVCKVTAEASVV